jgi:ubiquinone/menaquinone biosynthesis C-methylase UbiE
MRAQRAGRADNDTMRWLKRAPSEPLTVAMAGIKLANRVLVVGCSDRALIAALAIKAGLTGRACAVDTDAARVEATARAVEREGALVETFTTPLTTLPFEGSAFDVVVLRDVLAGAAAGDRPAIAAEAQRVVRPGGRCLAIDTSSRSSLGGLLARPVNPEYLAGGGAPPLLLAAGFAAVRTLAERDGQTFVEGVKRNV